MAIGASKKFFFLNGLAFTSPLDGLANSGGTFFAASLREEPLLHYILSFVATDMKYAICGTDGTWTPSTIAECDAIRNTMGSFKILFVNELINQCRNPHSFYTSLL